MRLPACARSESKKRTAAEREHVCDVTNTYGCSWKHFQSDDEPSICYSTKFISFVSSRWSWADGNAQRTATVATENWKLLFRKRYSLLNSCCRCHGAPSFHFRRSQIFGYAHFVEMQIEIIIKSIKYRRNSFGNQRVYVVMAKAEPYAKARILTRAFVYENTLNGGTTIRRSIFAQRKRNTNMRHPGLPGIVCGGG